MAYSRRKKPLGGRRGAGRRKVRREVNTISSKLTVLQLTCAILVVAVLYTLMDRQLSQRMTDNFMAHGDVVAEALAKSLDPALVYRDLTSLQSSPAPALCIPVVACI